MLEFAIVFPVFAMLAASMGLFTWLFFAQVAADMSGIRAVREGSINRGVRSYSPASSFSYYKDAAEGLAGGTASIFGSPDVRTNETMRLLRVLTTGGTDLDFAGFGTSYNFGGGGSSRINLFWPGPPAPWE